MQFLRLDSSFTPNVIIEKWKSLIWTERWFDFSDFQLKTYDMATKKRLPLGARVSLQDTREICLVENISIENDDEGRPLLTISGRDMSSILQDRVWSAGWDDPTTSQYTGTSAQAARAIMDRILIDGELSSSDILPNVALRNVHVSGLATKEFNIDAGNLYQRVQDIIIPSRLGIRTYRGNYITDPDGAYIEIHRGQDRTGDGDLAAVIFSVEAGDFEKNTKYLWTNKDSNNVAYIYSPVDNIFVPWSDADPTYSGFERHVLYVDANDITEVTTGHTSGGLLKTKARREMQKGYKTKQTVFDGQVSSLSKKRYNVHYELGDTVLVKGEYDVQQKLRVTEYIRNQDETGETGYPTLAMDD